MRTHAAKLLVVDNYDSFTFNLVQALATLGADVSVAENDRVDVARIREIGATHVVISPGPGRPEDAGASMDVARAAVEGALGNTRVLGVCLGHQCLGLAAGARVAPAKRLMHGRADAIEHDARTIFAGLPQPFVVGRYHSLAVEATPSIEVSARSSDGEVMALRLRTGCVEGVQFHPESILTPDGLRLLDNFLNGAPR